MMQNSKTILGSMKKHEKLVKDYETALNELNPNAADSKAIESLQNQVNTLQDSIKVLLEKLGNNN
jgi:chaperonin cofactor prefoldin